ncbi:MAG: response regulator transcription factor [Lachnospiraceae bacterium]|nr:response regulator transcription factor [Lachnospiraceae bacterium]
MDTKCLIVDDDVTIAENTAEYFNMFDLPTSYVTNYDEAIEFLESNEVSLILLDINLGERSGFELCKRIREDYDMPIFFISARKSDDNALMALNIGGDDYISKPFSVNILLAKVKTVLARYEKAAEAVKAATSQNKAETEIKERERIELSPGLFLDTSTHKLVRGEEIIALTLMEYKMLLYLLENRGRVVTKDELLESVWEDEYIGEGTLSVHTRHLREKTEKDPKNPDIIKTVWGVGYMIE